MATKRKPQDLDENQIVHALVTVATGGRNPRSHYATLMENRAKKAAAAKQAAKNPAAVALGRLGGLKGGKARMASLTPKERVALAEKAIMTRWKNRLTIDQLVAKTGVSKYAVKAAIARLRAKGFTSDDAKNQILTGTLAL